MLIYMMGAGHSGSSILDVILNNHSKITGTGELHRLSLTPQTRLCSCGQTITTCSVWESRIEEFCEKFDTTNDEWYKDYPLTHVRNNNLSNRINDVFYYLNNSFLINLISKINSFSVKTKQSIANTLKFHDIIQKKDRVDYVIDTSKNAIRMRAFSIFSDAKFIFIVRDGRAVSASAMRRKEGDMAQSAKEWKRAVSNIVKLKEKINKDRIHVIKYEDFCDNTRQEMNRLCSFLNLDFEENMLVTTDGQYHTIPGNPWLTKKKGEIVLRKDEKWKNELTSSDLKCFQEIGGKLNNKLGYS